MIEQIVLLYQKYGFKLSLRETQELFDVKMHTARLISRDCEKLQIPTYTKYVAKQTKQTKDAAEVLKEELYVDGRRI